MTINFDTALVTSALVGSILLAMKPPGNRLVPAIGLVAAAVLALMKYDVIQISAGKFRVKEVILPAILVVSGGLCWSRSSTKPAITAATVVAITGLILLLSGLKVLAG